MRLVSAAVPTAPLIAHVVNSLAIGGLENGVVNLINSSDARFRHAIVCMSGDGPLRDRLRPGIEVVVLGKRPGQDPWAFLRLVRLLRRMQPLIVHSRNWPAFDAVPAARVARVPLVVHGEHGREAADPEGRNGRRNRIRRALAPLVSHFVCVSDNLHRWLVDDVRVAPSKVTTIHNGVNVGRFGHGGQLESRVKLALPAKVPIIGSVGRLDPVKDQAGLVRAFETVCSTHPEALLVIAGDGPCRSDLQQLVESLGQSARVRLLGSRDDIPTVMAALDIFALPSLAEGMSNTVLEAMASGLPVIATRVGGSPELVEDGVTGVLVPRQDQAALAAAVAAYVRDPDLGRRHGCAARERARAHFSLERMVQSYTDLYASLASRCLVRSA